MAALRRAEALTRLILSEHLRFLDTLPPAGGGARRSERQKTAAPPFELLGLW